MFTDSWRKVTELSHSTKKETNTAHTHTCFNHHPQEVALISHSNTEVVWGCKYLFLYEKSIATKKYNFQQACYTLVIGKILRVLAPGKTEQLQFDVWQMVQLKNGSKLKAQCHKWECSTSLKYPLKVRTGWTSAHEQRTHLYHYLAWEVMKPHKVTLKRRTI